jgi:16S rRNA (adenine1518-N6/adenine1519-N6)-dimethyltransferase
VIRLERRDGGIDNRLLAETFRVADAAFAQRRKTIRNSLKSTLHVDSERLDAALEAADIPGTVRAEPLPPEAFVALAKQLAEQA